MVKRKRIPLNLKGTDETYFRTREMSGQGERVETDHVQEPPRKEPKAIVKPETKARVKRRAAPEKQSAIEPEFKSEIVSRIIHLGIPLSKRIQQTAEDFGVPVDDLLFAARKKAIVNFRCVLNLSKKPAIENFDKGGETLRIAVSLSSGEQQKLKTWFDPLDIGLSTKMVSPLLTQALREEVKRICDASNDV